MFISTCDIACQLVSWSVHRGVRYLAHNPVHEVLWAWGVKHSLAFDGRNACQSQKLLIANAKNGNFPRMF